MSTRTLVLSIFAVGMLAACSKPAPQPAATEDDEGMASTPAVPEPARVETPEERAKQAEGLLSLIDSAPNCQAFRDELQQAGQSGNVPIDEMITIVSRAGQAGCNKKRE